jgi:hypothetical protein
LSLSSASAQRGKMSESPVCDAVYGYWSKVTSTPRARAAAMRASDCTLCPNCFRPPTLWWLICTGMAAASPIAIVSFTESSTPPPSSRMCEM